MTLTSYIILLEDIFDRWRYKNKWYLNHTVLLLRYTTYNVRIVQIYGAAGHGKDLIDAMSNSGVKSILKREIVGLDVWFSDNREN